MLFYRRARQREQRQHADRIEAVALGSKPGNKLWAFVKKLRSRV